jgi:hypothetical protein
MLQQILSTVEGYGLDVAGSAQRPEMVSVSGVPRGGFNPPPPPGTSEVLPKLSRIPSSMENTSVTIIRIRVTLISKLSVAHD